MRTPVHERERRERDCDCICHKCMLATLLFSVLALKDTYKLEYLLA